MEGGGFNAGDDDYRHDDAGISLPYTLNSKLMSRPSSSSLGIGTMTIDCGRVGSTRLLMLVQLLHRCRHQGFRIHHHRLRHHRCRHHHHHDDDDDDDDDDDHHHHQSSSSSRRHRRRRSSSSSATVSSRGRPRPPAPKKQRLRVQPPTCGFRLC